MNEVAQVQLASTWQTAPAYMDCPIVIPLNVKGATPHTRPARHVVLINGSSQHMQIYPGDTAANCTRLEYFTVCLRRK